MRIDPSDQFHLIFQEYIYHVHSSLTWIWLSVAIGSGWRGSISRLHLQCVRTLFFTIEHDFGENLTALQIDLEELFALVPWGVDDIVIHLEMGKRRLLKYILDLVGY